jgi:hypothetical protein
VAKRPARLRHADVRKAAHKDGTYERLYDAQGGVCAICGRPSPDRRLDIDHDHGGVLAVRGLLCRGCNMRLRKDMRPEWMRKAADYLEAHG